MDADEAFGKGLGGDRDGGFDGERRGVVEAKRSHLCHDPAQVKSVNFSSIERKGDTLG